MHYSESSAFWLSALCSRLEHCFAVLEDEEKAMAPLGLTAYKRWEDSPYETLRGSGNEFGVAIDPVWSVLPPEEHVAAPEDTMWLSMHSGLLDPEQVVCSRRQPAV